MQPRKDKYNKKLMKYLVTYEEGKDELSEDEEQRIHEDIEASTLWSLETSFNNIFDLMC